LGLFSPEGETAPDIYRKHVLRIEELERENKTLAKDAKDAEKRWQKAEEELADLREGEGEGTTAGEGAGEVGKLVSLRCLEASQDHELTQHNRRVNSLPSSAKTPSSKPRSAAATAPPRPSP
jgi:type II secretory pathway component PulJ